MFPVDLTGRAGRAGRGARRGSRKAVDLMPGAGPAEIGP